MKHTDELRMLATKYECGAMDSLELADRLRSYANRIQVETLIEEAQAILDEDDGREEAGIAAAVPC